MFDNEMDRASIQNVVFDEKYVKPDLNGFSAPGSGRSAPKKGVSL